MSRYHVRIFLRRPDQKAGRYIGEHDLEELPRVGTRVAFKQGGRIEAGLVESVIPDNWRPESELIPSVHVLEDEPGPRPTKKKPSPSRRAGCRALRSARRRDSQAVRVARLSCGKM